MSNKDRVFVAVYFRQGITSDSKSRDALTHAAYHWAIWVEPKGSRGEGSSFDVKQHPPYTNIGDPGGWRYTYKDTADWRRSQSMLGRIMIGKLPKNTSKQDLNAILEKLQLPQEDAAPVQNCVSWTKDAIEHLQKRQLVEQFDVDQFMDHALSLGDDWYQTSRDLKAGPKKVNYTNRDM